MRFGRVTFKVTELVITQEEIEQTAIAIEALQNGRFKVGDNLKSEVDLNSSMPDLAKSLQVGTLQLKGALNKSSHSIGGRNNSMVNSI